jgi:hypothetical protein
MESSARELNVNELIINTPKELRIELRVKHGRSSPHFLVSQNPKVIGVEK